MGEEKLRPEDCAEDRNFQHRERKNVSKKQKKGKKLPCEELSWKPLRQRKSVLPKEAAEFTPAVLKSQLNKVIADRGKSGTDPKIQIAKLKKLCHKVSYTLHFLSRETIILPSTILKKPAGLLPWVC